MWVAGSCPLARAERSGVARSSRKFRVRSGEAVLAETSPHPFAASRERSRSAGGPHAKPPLQGASTQLKLKLVPTAGIMNGPLTALI
jgi:hypothetical protein